MRYYYKLMESADRQDTILHDDGEPKPITLYPETEEIKTSWETDNDSPWWPVHRFDDFSFNPGDFATEQEAYKELYANEAFSIYEHIHDL